MSITFPPIRKKRFGLTKIISVILVEVFIQILLTHINQCEFVWFHSVESFKDNFANICQKLANYSHCAVPPHIFINKVLLEHHSTYLFTYCLCTFIAKVAEVQQTICLTKPKIFTLWPFTKVC